MLKLPPKWLVENAIVAYNSQKKLAETMRRIDIFLENKGYDVYALRKESESILTLLECGGFYSQQEMIEQLNQDYHFYSPEIEICEVCGLIGRN